MTPGQNSTLNCDPKPRLQFKVDSWVGVTIQRWIQTWGHNSTWNQDLGSQFNVESWPGVKFQYRILTLVPIQRGIMTRGHISTWNYDPGSQFNVELWPRVKIPRWIMTPCQNSTLNCDPNPGSQFNVESWLGSKFNVELRPGVIIQRGIKTRGHNSTRGPNFIRRRVVIQWPPVSGGRNSTWKICWILSTARWIKTPRVEIQWGQNSILHRRRSHTQFGGWKKPFHYWHGT